MDGAAAENGREMAIAKHGESRWRIHKILSQSIDLFHTLCARTLEVYMYMFPIVMLRYLDRREIY